MKTVYIALPYSHESASVRKFRYLECVKYAFELAAKGINFNSPVLLTHDVYELSLAANVSIPYQFYIDMSEHGIKQADELHLLKLAGWDKSKGVGLELQWAKEHNMPIIEISPTRHYVSDEYIKFFTGASPDYVLNKIDYILFESSTDYIIHNGLPSTEEVQTWINILEARLDKDDKYIRFAIKDCKEYMNPNTNHMENE